MENTNLCQITKEHRKTFLDYANAQRMEKEGKAYQKDHKPDVIQLFNGFGSIVKETPTTTTCQVTFREDNIIHTAQMEMCNKTTTDTAAYVAYLEELLANNGIAHKTSDDPAFIKHTSSCTIRILTAEKTKKAVK